jgi:hypothetical protein
MGIMAGFAAMEGLRCASLQVDPYLTYESLLPVLHTLGSWLALVLLEEPLLFARN